MAMTQSENRVPGFGADRRPEDRPGVPMELDPPHPIEGAHWTEPEPQPLTTRVTRRMELETLTPVFGTAQPPSGLSGIVRRLAYRIPEHRARHWLLLLIADRIDVFEHALLPRAKWIPLALPLLALAGVRARAMSRRRRGWRRVLARA